MDEIILSSPKRGKKRPTLIPRHHGYSEYGSWIACSVLHLKNQIPLESFQRGNLQPSKALQWEMGWAK